MTTWPHQYVAKDVILQLKSTGKKGNAQLHFLNTFFINQTSFWIYCRGYTL